MRTMQLATHVYAATIMEAFKNERSGGSFAPNTVMFTCTLFLVGFSP
jgi:hypothetical protein